MKWGQSTIKYIKTYRWKKNEVKEERKSKKPGNFELNWNLHWFVALSRVGSGRRQKLEGADMRSISDIKLWEGILFLASRLTDSIQNLMR